MLRRVAHLRINVSKEHIASIIKVKRISEPGTNLAAFATETRAVWRPYAPPKRQFLQEPYGVIPKDGILHSHRRQNLKSYHF
jgi:hypothetical protein